MTSRDSGVGTRGSGRVGRRPRAPSLGPRAPWRHLRAIIGATLLGSSPVHAQIDPAAHWRTLRTEHFAVHYTPQLEALARRSAVNAERAYALLAQELVRPRGTIDLVLSDEVDLSNGAATPIPSNRIVIYASPPVAESALRFTDDWSAMVILHELTHVFHLDRSRGVWALGQRVFGRAPFLFPNEYAPSWLTEGLAVYYESRFTGAGRLRGSEHRALARAAALDHRLPALGSVSLATSRFPFGESSYAYGSLFVDWLARTRGEERVGRFVEVSSAQLLPLWLNHAARRGFGISFSRAWRQWSDSVRRAMAEASPSPLPAWRDLDLSLADAQPRWIGDSALVYSGTRGREGFAAYRLALDGTRTRLGRRNGRSPNVRLPDGSLLFAQLDFTGPYTLRSDLWIQRAGGEQLRLTRGARLALPDARADGAIVAMQVVAGGTRIVRVARDGAVTLLTAGGIDEQWTEPRWSRRGDRIAASRWRRGGISEIVVLDTLGREPRVIAGGHSVYSAPAWLDDDRAVAFTSDRTGTTELWVHVLERGALGLAPGDHRLSRATTGLFDADFAATGLVAATLLRGDGFHVGVGRCCDTASVLADSAWSSATTAATAMAPAGSSDAPSRRFSPWRTLAPRYWLPVVSTGMGNDVLLGALTSGEDAIGRHSFAATVATVPDFAYTVGGVAYRYAGLGLPVLELAASQDWDVRGIITSGTDSVGVLQRRTRDADLTATWLRPRVRTALSFSLGAGAEQRVYLAAPRTITLADSARRFAAATVPRVFASVGWANTQRPPLSISPEDGISTTLAVRERLRSGYGARGGVSTSVVGVVRAYRSLPLPGYAHHVLALRAAGGWADTRTNEYFEPGGTSGSIIELLPGYTIGEGGRAFGVRGFPAATLIGIRALGGSAEYRAPLLAPARGLGLLPVFFDKTSLSLYADAASAWCPSASAGRQVCTIPELTRRGTIASVGGELAVQAALLSWDAPYRLRAGIAHPVRGRELGPDVGAWTFYGAAGFSF